MPDVAISVRILVASCALWSLLGKRLAVDEGGMITLVDSESDVDNALALAEENATAPYTDTMKGMYDSVPFDAYVIWEDLDGPLPGLPVTRTEARSIETDQFLSKGTEVHVVELASPDGDGRVRARIDSPVSGWISAFSSNLELGRDGKCENCNLFRGATQFIAKYYRERFECPAEAFMAPNPQMSNWTRWKTGIPQGSRVKFLASEDSWHGARQVSEKGSHSEYENQEATVVKEDLHVNVGPGIPLHASKVCWFTGYLKFESDSQTKHFHNVAVQLIIKFEELNDEKNEDFEGLGQALEPEEKTLILEEFVDQEKGEYKLKPEALAAAVDAVELDALETQKKIPEVVIQLRNEPDPNALAIVPYVNASALVPYVEKKAPLHIVPDMPSPEEAVLSAAVRVKADGIKALHGIDGADLPKNRRTDQQVEGLVAACVGLSKGVVERRKCCIEACPSLDNECVRDCNTRKPKGK